MRIILEKVYRNKKYTFFYGRNYVRRGTVKITNDGMCPLVMKATTTLVPSIILKFYSRTDFDILTYLN